MAMVSSFRRISESRPRLRLPLKRIGVRERNPYRPRVELLEDRCLLAWSAIGPAPQQQSGGPVTGRVTALAFAKVQIQAAPTLFLGSAGGGVWSSTLSMGRAHYFGALTDNFPVIDSASGLGAGAIDVGTIAIDPNDTIGTIYVGTGEPNGSGDSRYGTGILKSTDGGNTFQLIATGTADRPQAFFRHAFSKIIVDPRNGSVLYAAVVPALDGGFRLVNRDDGIYKSTDGGNTWVQLTRNGQWATGIDVTDLDYTWNSSANPPTLTLFAGIHNGQTGGGGGVWWSSDDGNNWNPPYQMVGFAPSGYINRIALAADHRSGRYVVYAAVANFEKNNSLESVYLSGDNGVTWRDLNPQATSFTVLSDNEITATVPGASAAGTIDVIVTNQTGRSTGIFSTVVTPASLTTVTAVQQGTIPTISGRVADLRGQATR